MLRMLLAAMLTRAGITIAVAVVTVPLILNLGMSYIDTIDRIGAGEDVIPQAPIDAATKGIPIGATQQRAEQVLGARSVAVASSNPAERCRGYELGKTGQSLVICYTRSGAGAEQRWLVSSSRLDVGLPG